MLSSREAEFLLAELCSRLGLCLPPDARDRLIACVPVSAEAFAAAVFRAEGLERGPANRRLFADALATAERAFARAAVTG
jgi:hypothetical protein